MWIAVGVGLLSEVELASEERECLFSSSSLLLHACMDTWACIGLCVPCYRMSESITLVDEHHYIKCLKELVLAFRLLAKKCWKALLRMLYFGSV